MKVTEECDRCHQTFEQTIQDGSTVHSQLKSFWGLCNLFGNEAAAAARPDRPARISLTVAMRQNMAHNAVPASTRICQSCTDEYVKQHTAFATKWFKSYALHARVRELTHPVQEDDPDDDQ